MINRRTQRSESAGLAIALIPSLKLRFAITKLQAASISLTIDAFQRRKGYLGLIVRFMKIFYDKISAACFAK